MKIGDEVYVHGYVDEIRKDVIIIRNDGGYFGTVPSEMLYYEEDGRGYGTMNSADNPQTEPMKTADYCDICKQDMCEFCIADASNPYCVPSHYEIKQTNCPWK